MLCNAASGGVDGALSRTINVVEVCLGRARKRLPQRLFDWLTTDEHELRQALGTIDKAGGDEQSQHVRSAIEHVHWIFAEVVDQRFGVTSYFVRQNAKRMAVQ